MTALLVISVELLVSLCVEGGDTRTFVIEQNALPVDTRVLGLQHVEPHLMTVYAVLESQSGFAAETIVGDYEGVPVLASPHIRAVYHVGEVRQ